MDNLENALDELGGMENSITMQTDDGEEVTFYVLEETKINGENYLLVSDSKEEDGDCFLLKDHKCRPLFREQVPGWVLVENIIKMVCIV